MKMYTVGLEIFTVMKFSRFSRLGSIRDFFLISHYIIIHVSNDSSNPRKINSRNTMYSLYCETTNIFNHENFQSYSNPCTLCVTPGIAKTMGQGYNWGNWGYSSLLKVVGNRRVMLPISLKIMYLYVLVARICYCNNGWYYI